MEASFTPTGEKIMRNETSKKVVVYSTKTCPYCDRAKALLNKLGVPYEEILVDDNPKLRTEMEQKSGRRTVPQIFIDNRSIGGYDDLNALYTSGKLNELLF